MYTIIEGGGEREANIMVFSHYNDFTLSMLNFRLLTYHAYFNLQ